MVSLMNGIFECTCLTNYTIYKQAREIMIEVMKESIRKRKVMRDKLEQNINEARKYYTSYQGVVRAGAGGAGLEAESDGHRYMASLAANNASIMAALDMVKP
jgi:hypothetical protein